MLFLRIFTCAVNCIYAVMRSLYIDPNTQVYGIDGIHFFDFALPTGFAVIPVLIKI